MVSDEEALRAEVGSPQVRYSAGGVRSFEVEIRHRGLERYQTIKGRDGAVVMRRAVAKAVGWENEWRQQVELERAASRTEKAKRSLEALEGLLSHALSVDSGIDWDALKDTSEFPERKPRRPVPPRAGCLDQLLPSMWRKYQGELRRFEAQYQASVRAWEDRRAEFARQQEERNAAVDRLRAGYESGEPEAVAEYCRRVLEGSVYPDGFPKSLETEYNRANGLLVVNYQLPSPEDIPTLCEVRYVKSRDESVEKHISQSQLNRLYDSVLYQTAIRTIDELYEADVVGAVSSIVFNGYVCTVDRATGLEITPCVLSLQVGREEFEPLNLSRVDPKACFKKLKGVAAARLYELTPIAPVLQMDRQDSRFVAPRAVADSLSEGENIAAMDWQDFEHLIRELFEREFAGHGGEVKITRASRDRGVDAVAYDPDPLRGGKTVIQAKRYTQTVGVAAVRDLYGTVVNEGANKGILVTTSDYGPEAYGFAKGKPLVLLNGSNLLHLLGRHGYRARIDIQEARKILADREGEQ